MLFKKDLVQTSKERSDFGELLGSSSPTKGKKKSTENGEAIKMETDDSTDSSSSPLKKPTKRKIDESNGQNEDSNSSPKVFLIESFDIHVPTRVIVIKRQLFM